LTVPGDVSKEADCREIVQRALDRFGRIDSLVHNAGVVEPIEPVAELDPEEWQQNWKVNLLGPAMLTQMALPELRKRKGRVIFITSGSAENVVGGWGAYSTAKAAANHLVRILAREEPEITTLALRPGIVDTQMQATIRDKGKSHMAEENYKWLYGLYEQGKLLPPDQPGLATACLALYAPQDWSGEILQWDERRVRELVKAHDEPGAYPE
jgi:NAD(P)-dependent dehydrogenase (short-subunit alcohol dehydrogenase family)